MVTAMDDSCPNGVREKEEEEVTPPGGQPGVEGPSAVRSAQGADTSGGEERRRTRRPVTYLQRWRHGGKCFMKHSESYSSNTTKVTAHGYVYRYDIHII